MQVSQSHMGSVSGSGLGLLPTPNEEHRHQYFTDFTWSKFFLYLVAGVYVIGVGIVSIVEPWMDLPCNDTEGKAIQFANPVYEGGKRCLHLRYVVLLGFTRTECSFARRLIASVFLGGLIGWERRQADRPAGIRTMSLVSLGSCLFTINSAFAFLNGPMEWDASRISAAIPSGVGFLGAGLIFKKEEKSETGDSNHVVHGLTTAASLWLSAAVGIACGGDLFMPASFGVAIMMLALRFGPRQHEDDDNDDDEDDLDEEEDDDGLNVGTSRSGPPDDGPFDSDKKKDDDRGESQQQSNLLDIGSPTRKSSDVPNYSAISTTSAHDETASLTNSTRGGANSGSVRNIDSGQNKRPSVRKRAAALGSIV